MTANQDDIDDIPSLVPERDELVQHRKQKRGTAPTARSGTAADSAVGGTSGTVIFFLTLLTLGLIGTGAAGYFFYQQGEQARADLLSATNRIMSLESTLNQMDESTRKSSMGLLQKVDSNFAEIDKLWAARNAVRAEVEKLSATTTALQKTITEVETVVTSHGTQLSGHNNQLTAAQTKIDQLVRNTAGIENLGQQLTQLNADLNRVKVQMNKLDADVGKRVGGVEQDIESINVSRLQMNQTISNLQNSINALQQKVGK